MMQKIRCPVVAELFRVSLESALPGSRIPGIRHWHVLRRLVESRQVELSDSTLPFRSREAGSLGEYFKGDCNMKHNTKRILSVLVCVLLAAALALGTLGCKAVEKTEESTAAVMENGATLGTGATAFTFTVVDPDGKETTVTIKTDKTTVGEALVELGLVSGTESEYGLMVDTINGITLDYNTDGMYWAFYIDGEYAMTGVDSTDIVAGSVYAFQAEKG